VKTGVRMTTENEALEELSRLRNRHVAKLLCFLGDSPPYIVAAIKKAFNMFAEDVQVNIIQNSERKENSDDYQEKDG
jgi:hypothetical protein